MTPEPPEFTAETLSPISPLPVHPPEPSNIPVLRNQIDQAFNMTSTHVEPQTTDDVMIPDTISESIVQVDSPSDSSFSDAYKAEEAPSGTTELRSGDENANADTDGGDDYAMTFDSDGEGQGDIQDVSESNIDANTEASPVAVPQSEPSQTTIPNDSSVSKSQNSLALSASLLPTNSPFDPAITTSPTLPAQAASNTTNSQVPAQEGVTSGEIDNIQRILDNITANAEKNELSLKSIQAVSPSLPQNTSGLSAHASLPPRPQIPQLHTVSYSTAPGVPSRPVATNLVAAGAPGTSTAPTGGLPPPPTMAFRPSSQSAASPITPTFQMQNNHMSGHENTVLLNHSPEVDELDRRWGPDVQKLYDAFLEKERGFVTAGQWDQFPVGSRLFIGKQAIS